MIVADGSGIQRYHNVQENCRRSSITNEDFFYLLKNVSVTLSKTTSR